MKMRWLKFHGILCDFICLFIVYFYFSDRLSIKYRLIIHLLHGNCQQEHQQEIYLSVKHIHKSDFVLVEQSITDLSTVMEHLDK